VEIVHADPAQATALRDLHLITWEVTYRDRAHEAWYRERLAAHAVRDWGENGANAEAALSESDSSGCCGADASAGSCCGQNDRGVITRDLYSVNEVAGLPSTAILASLGCGNPTALAQLNAGEVVLDLGSGGGIDVLLSARRVGAAGFAYGLDMTDEMLAIAERNALEHQATNVQFLKGTIEDLPLADNAVDVVISNCVINLSADKAQVLREAYRVLRPGGRFAVSDVVVQGHLPEDVRRSIELWVGCVAGTLEEDTYRVLLADAGFEDISVEMTRDYSAEKASEADAPDQARAFQDVASHGGRVISAFVRARKPVRS
jgi:arsenite methyltransferase